MPIRLTHTSTRCRSELSRPLRMAPPVISLQPTIPMADTSTARSKRGSPRSAQIAVAGEAIMERGDHNLLRAEPNWTDKEIKRRIFGPIFLWEYASITDRRWQTQKKISAGDPDVVKRGLGSRVRSPLTGLALSGGGIRSASVCLGALQAIHATVGIEGIDYLSTVSGGGYIGGCLTATMQKSEGKFPFIEHGSFEDTDSVRHIRDFSNYLMPHGKWDVITASAIFMRGLLANVIVMIPALLVFVILTVSFYSTVYSLEHPGIHLLYVFPYLQSKLYDWGASGFTLTITVFLYRSNCPSSMCSTEIFIR